MEDEIQVLTSRKKVGTKKVWKNRKLKTGEFSIEAKKRLCSLVKSKPVIWSLLHPLHRRLDAQAVAWSEISTDLGRSVAQCKAQWKSLNDSRRLRQKQQRGKSGDSAEEGHDSDDLEQSEPNAETDTKRETAWQFWDDLTFLEHNKPSHRKVTLSTAVNVHEESDGEMEQETAGPNNQSSTSPDNIQMDSGPVTTSNYAYMVRKRKREQETGEAVLSGIKDLIELRKADTISQQPQDQLQYHKMFMNMDRMLTKLPEDTVEDLHLTFIGLIHTELKKAKKIITLDLAAE